MRTGLRTASAAATIVAASLAIGGGALAHLQGAAGGPDHGLSAGLLHPLTGLDHLLAMVAIGLWAAQRGGRDRWLLPALFVGTMIAGGAVSLILARMVALLGPALPGVELGLAGSVLLLGTLICAAPALRTSAAMGLVAAAALLHGYAHGTEIAAGLSPALFAGGLTIATAALHAGGVALGAVLLRLRGTSLLLRATGAGIASVGALLVTTLL